MDNNTTNNPINGTPSVLDMVEEYAKDAGTAVDDVFKRDRTATTPAEPESTIRPIHKEDTPQGGGWQPNPELLGDMPELNGSSGAVYSRDEYREDQKGPIELANITDDMIAQEAVGQMDELQRSNYNIAAAKKRLGVRHLNIPTIYTSRVMDSAADDNAARAGSGLDEILTEIITLFPDAVVEWLPGFGPKSEANAIPPTGPRPVEQTSETAGDNIQTDADPEVSTEEQRGPTPIAGDESVPLASDLQIVIDKSQATDVVFDEDDRAKIKKARSVELKIIEDRELHYNVIDDPENDIDVVLSQYTRKFNDKPVSLPASRYRCTVTGLSYPEILDLSYSQDLNNLEGEKKKWSIAYAHVRNASIGQFADFNDFLQKTSYLDLDFILWAILCATCMPKEIVSIDCHKEECKNTYDWVYAPATLLQMDKMSAQTLEEMRVTGEAATTEEIERNYNESMLRLGNVIELPTSKFVVGFGHISAYTYLEETYGKIESLRNNADTMMSDALEATALPIIKYFLLPDINGQGHRKVTKQDDVMKIIHVLDEIDFQTLSELMTLMTSPYELNFVLKDIVCPKCKTKSSITIEDMGRLLFIIAQSLSNVNVVLKKQ